MYKTWQLNHLKKIEELIPKYCYLSIDQDRNKLGDDTVNFLIAASSEYYLTGNIFQLLKDINGDSEIQDLTQNILDNFIQLFANQNLIIIVCNRIEILTKLDNTEHSIDRATLNQLVQLLERIKDKCPLSFYPLTPLKKLKINMGTKSLERAIKDVKVNTISLGNINLSVVKEQLNRVRL